MSFETSQNTEGIKRAWIGLALSFSLLSLFALPYSRAVAGESPDAAGEELSGYAVTAAAFAEKGGSFLLGTRQGELELWDLSKEDLKASFEQGKSEITAIAVSPDGRHAVTAARDRRLRVWDLSSRKLVRKARAQTKELEGLALAVSNGGRHLAYAQDKIVHILGGGKTTQRSFPVAVTRLCFSPDGRRILILGVSGRLEMLSLPSGEVSCSNEGMERGGLAWAVEDAAWNGATIAIGYDHHLRMFDAESCRERGSLRGHLNAVTALAFSADGKYLLSGGQEAAIRVWDAVSGKELHRFQTQLASISQVAFSPDNRYAMAWLEVPRTIYKVFQKWELATGRLVESRLPFIDRNVTPARSLYAAPDAAEVRGMQMEPCSAPDGSFRVSLPKDWPRSPLSPEEGTGFLCRGPGRETEPSVSVAHVDTSRKVYPRLRSLEACLGMDSRPVLGWSEPGSEYGDIEEITLAGRKAFAFEKRVFHRIPIYSLSSPEDEPSPGKPGVMYRRRERVMPSRTVLFYEKEVVVPDGRNFYVLHFETPAGMEATLGEIFERVVRSFEPGDDSVPK